jgi:hypothetical protein
MAIIELGTDGLEELFALEIEEPRAPGLADRLSGRWAAVLTVLWITIFSLGVALEPAPANEDAVPLLGAFLTTGLLAGWVTMAAGFAHRRRYGALGSLGAAGVLAAMTVACPLSGHHAGIGAWWWFEVAGSLTLVGASAAALRSA